MAEGCCAAKALGSAIELVWRESNDGDTDCRERSAGCQRPHVQHSCCSSVDLPALMGFERVVAAPAGRVRSSASIQIPQSEPLFCGYACQDEPTERSGIG